MRQVNIIFNESKKEEAQNAILDKQLQFQKAIGYLSTWSMDLNNSVVNIYVDENAEMEAYYFRNLNEPVDTSIIQLDVSNRRPDYVIGAVWSEDSLTYSFHS